MLIRIINETPGVIGAKDSWSTYSDHLWSEAFWLIASEPPLECAFLIKTADRLSSVA